MVLLVNRAESGHNQNEKARRGVGFVNVVCISMVILRTWWVIDSKLCGCHSEAAQLSGGTCVRSERNVAKSIF